MNNHARLLVIDDREETLRRALGPALAHHDVETVHDAVGALYCIDGEAHRPFDAILCDLGRGDLAGPELWAFLSITRKSAAARMVFVASEPLKPQTQAFLAAVPNTWVKLPLSGDDINLGAMRRAPAGRTEPARQSSPGGAP